MRNLILFAVLLAIGAGQTAIAQDENEIKKQIRQRTELFERRFNEHDAPGLAEIYSKDCDVIHVGVPFAGRKAIQAAFADYFVKNRTVMTGMEDVTYRILSSRFAVESGRWKEWGHTEENPNTEGTYTSVYEKLPGGWQIVHERAWTKKGDQPDVPGVTLEGAVPELGTYLHGSWKASGKNDGKQIKGRMTVRPSADGRSQFYEWTVEKEGAVSHGAAIGGVDPATGNVVEFGFAGDNHWTNRYEGTALTGTGKTTGVRTGVRDGKPFAGAITVNRTTLNRFEYQVESEGEIAIDYVFVRADSTK